MATKVYTLDETETADWIADVDVDDHAFTKRSLAKGEPAGTRIEIYAVDHRLLEAFSVS